MRYRSIILLAVPAALTGCAPDGNGATPEINAACEVLTPPAPLPDGLEETSGLALASGDAGAVWTHNDSGGDPALYAVRSGGAPVEIVRVAGARNRDWEALSAGPCPAGRCLYVGDIGDNEARRDEVAVYRVPEPDPGAAETQPAERFAFTYPGGPRDAESLFVLPDGEMYVVSKGRTSNVAVYRYPQPLRADEVVELEHVADLSSDRADLPQQVTGAEASPDGEWIAVRTYANLLLYRRADLLAGSPATSVIDLSALGEPQGEAVAIHDDGRVVLTSEASGEGPSGTIAVLQCGGATGAELDSLP